ncbi:hypothetical protein PROH_07575 [Prochlorothrix hollandica PCC 9006 = CALU 1027]|uniref:Uncharacterized protein n=1 Tax=Prochlorothrix hollandica PCC 9006 = CALU 1027 TaxID=317619 RepID=A0A0M2PXB4_PROHO|nr:hypothetical protein PROH_07575 [Prochlorothrix hollandica PCC 9006 = CALU 1027]
MNLVMAGAANPQRGGNSFMTGIALLHINLVVQRLGNQVMTGQRDWACAQLAELGLRRQANGIDHGCSGITRELWRDDPLGIEVDTLPVDVVEAIQTHRTATGRRMHETPFAHIDPGMTDGAPAIGGKEHQIATLQGVAADIRCAHGTQLTRRTRQTDTSGIAINVADQAAAVETAFRGVATVAIRRTDQAKGAEQHVLSAALIGGRRDWRGVTRLGRRSATAAGTQQQSESDEGNTGRGGHKRGDPEPECALLCRFTTNGATLRVRRDTSVLTLGCELLVHRSQREYALGLQITAVPVAVIETVDAHTTAAAAAGVDELIIPQIDAGVADATTTTIIEQDQIARFQIGTRHLRRIEVDQLTRGARQLQADFLAEQVADETAAIETGLHRGAAVAIARADQRTPEIQQAVCQLRHFIGFVVDQRGDFIVSRFNLLRERTSNWPLPRSSRSSAVC